MVKVLLVSVVLLVVGIPLQAQQCGVADSISYPVDTDTFSLVQDFEAASPRHQGRYHTGEDWYAGRANNYGLGMPVVAAATGRVTFSSPIGWGRDGGVVIIEHTLPDGSLLYTHYGHMMETETARFPAQWGCVQAGEVIGAVGSARPAPHLHFEVRNQDGTSPGPGYSWNLPSSQNWRRPAKVLANWQASLQPAHRWRLDLVDERGPVAPPLELDDHSLLYLDVNRLRRVTPDGRSLWRINLEREAVSITELDNQPLLTYADGGMQRVNIDGTLSERWETGVRLGNPVIIRPELLIFQSSDGTLTAFGPDRQTVLWQLVDIPPVAHAGVASQVIALVTETNELLTLSLQGQHLHRTALHNGGRLYHTPDGELSVYDGGGLWLIRTDGIQAAEMAEAPPGGRTGAALHAADSSLYLFDGAVLHAYNPNRTLRWQVQLPETVGGLANLSETGGTLLFTSNYGDIIVMQPETGGVCGLTRIYGSDRAGFWHQLGDDGILRVYVSDQIIGLDWGTFAGNCLSN